MRACFMLERVRTIEIGAHQGFLKDAHTLFTGERERCRICSELLFLFLKGLTGTSSPFSYLVYYKTLHFIRNIQMGPISKSDRPWESISSVV